MLSFGRKIHVCAFYTASKNKEHELCQKLLLLKKESDFSIEKTLSFRNDIEVYSKLCAFLKYEKNCKINAGRFLSAI